MAPLYSSTTSGHVSVGGNMDGAYALAYLAIAIKNWPIAAGARVTEAVAYAQGDRWQGPVTTEPRLKMFNEFEKIKAGL